MRTAPLRQAAGPRAIEARTAPNGQALYRALEVKPADGLAEEHSGKRAGRVKLFRGKHVPRHARPAATPETDGDAEAAAQEFRALAQDPPPPDPAARRTGPQPARVTGPLPTFTPNGRHTGPQRASWWTEGEILAVARRRADTVPVPEPPAAPAVPAGQACRVGALRYPAYDAADGYGTVPQYVALMQQADRLTGTTSRYVFPAAWPLPVAPLVARRGTPDRHGERHGLEVTPGDEASHEVFPRFAGETPGSAS